MDDQDTLTGDQVILTVTDPPFSFSNHHSVVVTNALGLLRHL